MGRTHLAITVELVSGGHSGNLRHRPGRVMIAAGSATFEQFATAIDDAFARWDRNHLPKARLGRLRLGEQFAYVFDLGDNWQHLCTVGRDWNGDDGDTPGASRPRRANGPPAILPWRGPPARADSRPYLCDMPAWAVLMILSISAGSSATWNSSSSSGPMLPWASIVSFSQPSRPFQ